MKFFRPGTIEEALELLAEGVPLAGGTTLVPERRKFEAVVALDKLGLDKIKIEADSVQIGASTRLQKLLEPELVIPVDLIRACRLEAAWNLRNMASMAGTIMSADARSPLLVTLLALGASVTISGTSSDIALDDVLEQRRTEDGTFLIESVRFKQPESLRYESVARTPTDRPLVSAAAAAPVGGAPFRVAIGGYGLRPILLAPVEKEGIEASKKEAAQQFSSAGDAFASAEYRSEIVAILVERALKEVQR